MSILDDFQFSARLERTGTITSYPLYVVTVSHIKGGTFEFQYAHDSYLRSWLPVSDRARFPKDVVVPPALSDIVVGECVTQIQRLACEGHALYRWLNESTEEIPPTKQQVLSFLAQGAWSVWFGQRIEDYCHVENLCTDSIIANRQWEDCRTKADFFRRCRIEDSQVIWSLI